MVPGLSPVITTPSPKRTENSAIAGLNARASRKANPRPLPLHSSGPANDPSPFADPEFPLFVVEVILPTLANRGAMAVLQLHDPVRLAAGLADDGAGAVAGDHHAITEAERKIGHRRHHRQGKQGGNQQSHVVLLVGPGQRTLALD